MRLEERINKIKTFSNTEYSLIEYILSAKSKVISMQTADLAEVTFTSPASVTRLSKKLGFSGFNELKFFLKSELERQEKISMESWDLLQNDVNKTISLISETNLIPMSELIAKATKIFVFGTDWGERNATELLVRNFMTIGVFLISVPSITEFRWIAEEVTPNDLVIVVSFSGENTEVTEISRLILLKGTEIISITPLTKNHLSSLTVNNLYYQTSELPRLNNNPNAEYNMFTTLHIVLDALFRNYYDNFLHS
ncbi:MurR/RpiR family transcriptional regulator [Enterococcus montenegrensis]|uniref:MurR/RpiR family transcriptional regulator n=1 Tax=Enterococcus TaxID=1350 RepID=UPI001E55DBEC|nr:MULTISPECIES: MurR/RpiR family transcriptional regulator [Enterococcus]MCD1024788.1 MurR/RpiR family transcriptional regulator [Enterococcus sp. SMC-9]WHA08902.1 MurR/RpiR family transcriptional regulator [Enterococcus montenegrensis]